MIASSLLQKYENLGISLYLKPIKRLGYKAQHGVVTVAIKQEIQEYKDKIIEHITYEQTKDLPKTWKLAITKTLAIKDHEKISKSRWEAILNQIHLWIGKDKDQLYKIISDDWSIQDIFGCHKIHPEARIDYMGLLMLVKGRSIIRVNMGAITLQTSHGAEQTFHYKNILDRPENGEIYNT